jgi:hypothetical protein
MLASDERFKRRARTLRAEPGCSPADRKPSRRRRPPARVVAAARRIARALDEIVRAAREAP